MYSVNLSCVDINKLSADYKNQQKLGLLKTTFHYRKGQALKKQTKKLIYYHQLAKISSTIPYQQRQSGKNMLPS